MPTANEINVEKPKADANVVTSRKANVPLIVLGVLLVLGFAGGVAWSRAVGSETIETTPPSITGATGDSGPTDQAEATTKTTETKSVPSESLLTAVLGSGAALIIVGLLYGRISTIKLPGGVEIGVTADEKEKAAEALGRKIKEKAADPSQVDPVTTAELTQKATDQMLRAKARGPELHEEEIDSIVEKLVDKVEI